MECWSENKEYGTRNAECGEFGVYKTQPMENA